MRTIRVTGKGQIKVKPDMTRITMALDGLFKDYGETLRHSSEETEVLKDVLSGFGFERADLKTFNFRVDTEYESYKDRDGSYKQRFSGYRFRHMLKVEFPSDKNYLQTQTQQKAKTSDRACVFDDFYFSRSSGFTKVNLSYSPSYPQTPIRGELVTGSIISCSCSSAQASQKNGLSASHIHSVQI